MSRRSLQTRVAVASQAVQALEHAADAEWKRAEPYFLPRPLVRTTARLDAWWRLFVQASDARTRLGVLSDRLAVERLDELAAAGCADLFSSSSSWGVPGSPRGEEASSSALPASPAPPAFLDSASGTAPALLEEGNHAPTPEGYTGTPQPASHLETGASDAEAAEHTPGRVSAAPPHSAQSCRICAFTATHLRVPAPAEV